MSGRPVLQALNLMADAIEALTLGERGRAAGYVMRARDILDQLAEGEEANSAKAIRSVVETSLARRRAGLW